MAVGITQPLRISKASDFQTETGPNLVDKSVEAVVMTQSSGEGFQGETPWDPGFGSLVPTLRHMRQDKDLVQAEAIRMAANGVAKYVPGVTILGVLVEEERRDTGLALGMEIIRSYSGSIESLNTELKQ